MNVRTTRQQAPDKDGTPAIAIEPALGPLDPGPAAEEPRPSTRGRLASVPASRPGQIAADHIARHAGHDDQRQAEVHPGHRTRRYRSAQRHRELRGYWNAGRLCGHQQEYGQISVGADEMLHPRRPGQSSIGEPPIEELPPGGTDAELPPDSPAKRLVF
jgi:hypothetical protein